MVDQAGDSLYVRMEEEQILNFETWTVPATNLITLAGPTLLIRDFALRHQGQSLSARTLDPGDVEITFDDFNLRTPSRLVFSEEEVAAGVLNGTVGLDNAMSNLGIHTDLTIDDLSWTGQLIGDLTAQVTTTDEEVYNLDVTLKEQGNDVAVNGTYNLNGPMDITVDLKQLQLATAEPFSLEYLTDTEGYLNGRIKLTGTATDPLINGSVAFRDASLVISLLGERFRMGGESHHLHRAAHCLH